jgi:hypothetical protein
MFDFTHEELGLEKPTEPTPEAEKTQDDWTKGVTYRPDGTVVDPKETRWLFEDRPTLGEFTSKMIGSGFDQVQGLGMGVVGLAGDLAGSETVKQIGLEGLQRNMQEAAQAREDVGMVENFDEIDGVGSAGKFVYGYMLEQLPQLLPNIALGGVGGIVGKQLVKKGLQEVIETGVSSGLTREAAEAAVANAVATRGGAKAFLTGAVDQAAARQLMAKGFTREATEQSLGKIAAGKLAPQAGVAAGNIVAGQAMSMGSIYGETEDASLALGYGAAAGAVEGLADTVLFSPFTKRAFGVDVAERIAKNKSLPKEIGKGFVKGVAVEGPLEEYPQTYIEQMARAEADPTFDINSEEAKRERLNAMAVGSVVGGTIGPVGGALEALAPRTKEALNRFTQKPLSDPETGLPTEPQGPPPAREYDQEAVTLEDGTVMRRFKIAGTSQEGWAVENASEEVRGKIAKGGYMDDDKIILAPGFTNSATLIQRAEDARAKALGKIDDKEVDEKAPAPRSLSPFKGIAELFDEFNDDLKKAEIEVFGAEAEPDANVVKDFGIATPVKFKPAPEALGRRVRYEGYEGVLAQDGERYKLRVDDKTDVELPANAEVETAAPVPVSPLRGDTALTTTVRTDGSSDLVKDFGIKSQDGQTAKSPGSYPGAEGSTPSPATPDIDAINEIAKATLDLEPVGIVDALEEVSKTEALDDNAISLLDDAQRALEDGITQIESRDLSPDAKKKATDSLYAKLDQVDRIQQRFVPDKEPSTKLSPAPLEKELEAAQVEYERKLAEQQQATKQATEDRTPEQTQAFVAGLKQGDQVIVDLDGSDDIVGSVEGTTDEGALIVRDKKTKKPRAVSKTMQDRVALAPEQIAQPTLETVAQAALGPKPTRETLTRAGFAPTEEVISEKVGDTVHASVPVFNFTAPKDRVDQRKLPLKATFYAEEGGTPAPRFFYEHTNDTTKQPETQVRDMLRAMDRGYEVRIPNNVEAPLGVQTTPVEGTNYRVVTAIQDFRWTGANANLGSFVWGNRGLRHLESGREGTGTFSDLWQKNSDIQAQRGARSQQINQTLQERGTDATTGAAKRAQGFNDIATSIYTAIFGGDYGARINYIVEGDELSGASREARDDFRDKATNKLINAIGNAGLDKIEISPEQRPLIQTTIDAYLEKQSAEKSKTIEGGKLGPEGIIELKEVLLDDEAGTIANLNSRIKAATKDTPPAEYRRLVQEKKKFLKEAEQSPQGQTVNTTLDALQRVAMFSNPTTQQSVLAQAKSDALEKAGARPSAPVSLDAPVSDESGAVLGDFVTGKGTGLSGATSAATEAKDFEAEQGEVSEEEAKVIEAQKKEAAEIVDTISDSDRLEIFVESLSPLEKIAYNYLSTADTPAWRSRKQKLYGQLEDQIEDPDEFIRDTEEKIADFARRAAERAGGKTFSPAVRSERQTRGAAGLEGGTLNRTSTTESVRRIKRRFLQARAGLTDEQIVAMADDEIDRAFLAFNSRADESKAAKAQDAVVSVAPGIEDLLTRSSGELLAGYAEQVREAAEAGDMGAVRDANFAELVRLGAFASTREFLSRVSDPKNGLPRDMQLRAKAFLGLEKRGFKLDAIEIQAANFLKTGTPDRASWAGLLGRSADYKSFGVYINLDQAHDRGTAAQTILHELSHAATLAKINGQAKLTPDEKQAIADLNAMRRRAILRAGDASPTVKAEAEAKGITDPRDRTAFYEKRLRELSSTDPEFRDYNGLANLDEFVVELTGSPDFLDLLRRLGFGGADTDRKSLGGMIRDAFKAILKLVAPGISATSEIGKAFTDSWNLTYAGSKPVVSPGELLQATRGITEVKEAAPVPKKGTKKKSTTVEAAAPQGKAAETQTETSTAKTPASVSPKAPQGGKGSVTSDNDKATTQTPESNNQPSAQPEPKNPEVPEAGGAGEGSGAAVEAKPKRGKGRPTKREMRDETKLPVSREEFEAEMAQGEMTPEEREAEFKEAPQSPAAKPRVVKAALTDDERDLAELRASNMEDILFYNGITEQQYYTLVGEGILTPKEIESGYMQNVPQMLSNISGDESQPGPLRHVAQMLLDLGFDFSKVRFRVAETADAQAEGGWAGLYRAGTSARSGEISINMDSDHRGGVAQSIVHEALHHVFFWKTQKGYPLNRVERAAFNDLQKIFKQAERAALGRYARGGETIGQARARLAPGDLFYGLTNVDEFITEILTNPEFQVFLQQVPPMQSLPKKGGYIRNLLDQIFSYFRDFIYGRDVSGDSLLTQGLDNVLALIQTPQTESGVQRAMDQMLGEPVARATYGGEKADMPQFMRDSLDSARAMAAAGKTSEEIRAVTGWFPGKYDGKMRWEIPDKGASLTDKWRQLKEPDLSDSERWATEGFASFEKGLNAIGLADALDHPELFASYPELANVRVVKYKPILDFLGATQGSFNPATNTINITPGAENPLSTILHEAQHWIQSREGFGIGAAPESVVNLISPEQKKVIASEIKENAAALTKEKEKELVKAEQLMDVINRIDPNGFDEAVKNLKKAEKTFRRQELANKFLKSIGLRQKYGAYEAVNTARNNLRKIAGFSDLESTKEARELFDRSWHILGPVQDADSYDKLKREAEEKETRAKKDYERIQKTIQEAGKDEESFLNALNTFPSISYDLYRKVSGEIESRDVQARMDFTETQRKAAEPYSSENIAPEDAIIIQASPAPMSPAGDLKKTVAKLTGKEIITTPSGGTYEKGGLLSTDGKLDKRAGDRWRKRNMKIGAQERMVNLAVQKLVAAVKGERKAGREVSTDLMNTALGNLDNPLTRPQRNEVEALRAEAKEAKPKQREAIEKEANELEAAYMAKNREAFKVRQAQALAQLPEDVAEAISEMTQHITALSSALKASGIVEPGLGATIDANLGIYLHRSYEIFDNPKWKEAVLKNEKIINDAQNLLRRNIEGRNADKLIAQAAEQGGILPRAEAMRQARGTAKQEEVDRMLEQLLAVGEESLGGVILKGRIPGQMDLSILDSRGNITPEIQALWGRYEDPTINYAKTALKITTLLENNAFLGDLRALGLKEGWLHEGADHPPGYLKISSDNNKSLAPIAGLYGNRDLVEALYAMYPQNGVEENYAWVGFFSKLTGVSMASKTVLSAAAHVRNFAGNFLNLAASGNLGINDLPFVSGGRYKKALNLTIRSTFSNMSAQQFKDTIKELTELGVLNESLTSGLLKDLIGTKRVAGNALAFSDSITDRLLKKPAAAIWDVAQKSYGSGDEFFKVVIYLSEMEKYRKAMPEWSEQQLKENAAKIARDVHWTYSLSPVAVGKIKQFPFVAPFITFTTEVIRTTRNTMALAYNEIKEGNRTGNKELSAIGWKRVRGMTIAALAPSAAASAIGAMAGISGEDDDDLRRFLPDWQKNSQLLVFKNSDGKVSFIDVSYLDPYEYWKRPVTAFLRALAAPDDSSAMERITEGAVQAGAQLINPFASEQILSGAILDLARNQKQNGQEVWNPEDTGMRVAAKVGDHLWNAFEPGTLTSSGRVLDAALGNVSDSGRSYGLFNELASVGLGQRISELDVTQALGFKTSQANRALRDASSLFTREFSSKGTRSEDQIMDAYARANDATFEITKGFREDVDAAMRLSGMSAKQMKEILAAGGMGKEKIKMVQTGRFTRYTPSEQQIKLAKSLGNQDRIQAARRAESGVPRTAELR